MKFEEWYHDRFGDPTDYNSKITAQRAWGFQEERYLELIQELASLRPCKATSGVGELVKKAKELLK